MECATAPVDHVAWFYDERAHLIQKVASFSAEGLGAGETVVLIASHDHLTDIEKRLATDGVDIADLVTYDAATTLAGFYRDGVIDRDAFDDTVGALVRHHARYNRLRAFGEMVALLWDEGAVRATIELETLWCQLRTTHQFALLCAYPSSVMLEQRLHTPVNAVCELHSDIRIGAPDDDVSAIRVYPPSTAAVGAARRFVRSRLGGTGRRLDDVLLVTSELSANAVHHAHTSFALELTIDSDAVRIGVRDASALLPKLQPMTGTSESGRGIATVAALSSAWGVEPHAVGKTVWATLPV